MELYDYGDNNSDTTSSESTFGFNARRTKDSGIPTHCFCCGAAVLQTTQRGLNHGRLYYSCVNYDVSNYDVSNYDDGDCHISKWWDEAMMEEFRDMKEQIDNIDTYIRFITTTKDGDNVDTRMMWDNVLRTRDLVFPLKESVRVQATDLDKLKEMVGAFQGLSSDICELKDKVVKLQAMVYGERELKLMIGVLISLLSVLISFIIYFFK